MKRKILIVLIIIVSLVLVGSVINRLSNRPGDPNKVEVSIGSSERFSQEEMESAFEFVLTHLPRSRDGELTHLWYDAERSDSWIEFTTLGTYKENMIVLASIMEVRSTGTGWWSPGTWEVGWTLEKDRDNGVWILRHVGPHF